MKTITFKTAGVCASTINISVTEENIIDDIAFQGGCNGNLSGISLLAKGMDVNTVIERLDGVKCGFKSTSCPDQLAKALKEGAL